MNARVTMTETWPWGTRASEWLLYALLILALVLGGGSIAANWRIFAICATASALLAVAVASGGSSSFMRLSRLTRLALVLIPIIPLIQLVPLPPGVWISLPGRDVPGEVFELLGTRDQWHPLSLTPRNTWFALLMLLPAYAAFFGAMTLDDRSKRRMVVVFLAVVAVSVLVGMIQLGTRGGVFNFYDSAHKWNLIGFFANRNHQGLMLAIASMFSIALVRQTSTDRRTAIAWSAILSVAFLTAAVGTISRAGLGLTVLGLAMINYVYFISAVDRRRRLLTISAAVVTMLAIYFLSFNGVVERALARYNDVGDDPRWEIWKLIWPLVPQYFPWGSGLGSFVPAYSSIEMLDKVTPNYVNRAHNEYLELLIETGVPGIAVLAVFVSAIGARLILALRKKRPFGIFGLPAGLAILLVGLHSIVDYPLRTQSLAVLFGVILALFFSERKAKPPVSTTNRANHA